MSQTPSIAPAGRAIALDLLVAEECHADRARTYHQGHPGLNNPGGADRQRHPLTTS